MRLVLAFNHKAERIYNSTFGNTKISHLTRLSPEKPNMLGLSLCMSSYGERSIFMYVLGTLHRAASANRVVWGMRPLSQLGSKGPGWCTFCVLLQLASTAWMQASNSSCFVAIIQGNQRG